MIVSPEDGWQGTAAPRGNDGMGRKKNLLSCFGQLKTSDHLFTFSYAASHCRGAHAQTTHCQSAAP